MPRPKDFPTAVIRQLTERFDAATAPPFNQEPYRSQLLEAGYATWWIVMQLQAAGCNREQAGRAVQAFQARAVVIACSGDPWPFAEDVVAEAMSQPRDGSTPGAPPLDCRTCAHADPDGQCAYSGPQRESVDAWIDAQTWSWDLRLEPRLGAAPCPGHAVAP